jgi:uncharacterized membrane protein
MDYRWRRLHSLRTSEVLPLFDAVFAVAFTLLAYSVPEELEMGFDGVNGLLLAIASSLFSGIAVLLYWWKMRRLLRICRSLHSEQLLIGFASMLIIVAFPKLSQLALLYGGGQGDLLAWTPSQIVNVLFLGALFLFDGLCLGFALSLRSHQPLQPHSRQLLETAIEAQSVGFAVLMLLAVLELLFNWFNNQYLMLVPLVLLLEELLVVRRMASR